MDWFQTLPSRTAKVITDRNLRARATVFACAAIASFGFLSGTLTAREVSDRAGLREILADLASGRNVSARVSLPLQIGFFNGQTALYITPEVGVDPNAGPSTVAAAQQVATGFNANFIPLNFASLPGSGAVDDIFVFTNFSQGNVLASAPDPAGPGNTDTDYTPLWQVNLVSWIRGRPTVLTSQADISTAAQNGFVSVEKTPIIVECSVIFTPRGGLLPLATVREEPAEEADRR
jgi:hypothetical protein